MEPTTNKIEVEFERWFKLYFVPMVNFINSYINNPEESKEIVQNTFVKIWSNRSNLIIESSIKNYLFQSAKNMMLDHLRSTKKQSLRLDLNEVQLNQIPLEEAKNINPFLVRYTISQAATALKPKTWEIFTMWSEEGLTYEEIAKYLKIPKRTVEYNMSVAFEFLRSRLNPYEIGFDD